MRDHAPRSASASAKHRSAPDRGRVAGARAAVLDALAGDLRRLVTEGELSDLEALARLAERRAALAADSSLPERWRFIADLVSVVTEVDLSRLPPRRRSGYVAFGERGFRPEYHSLDRGSANQVRHLIGYLPVGFLTPVIVGAALSWLAEAAAALGRRRPVDWPDVRLGRRGVELGAAIRSGALPLDRVGQWLRAVVGEPEARGGRVGAATTPTPGMVDSAEPSVPLGGDSRE
jgi:hypothetical protein